MKTRFLLASLLVVGFSSLAQPKPFKTSCVSWCFHGFAAGTDVEPAIDTVAQLGFDGIQLMVCNAADLDNLWTDAKIARAKQTLADRKLDLVSLIPFFTCYPYMGSTDPAKVKADLATFERCCALAQKLGTKKIEMISPFVAEFEGFGGFANNPYFNYKIPDNAYKPGDKLRLKVAPNIDWAATEKRMMNVFSTCSKIAKKYGLGLIIEPHFHGIIPDNNGFLRLWDKLKDPNITCEMDAGWGTQQVEYPPMVVYRTGKHLSIMQFRDVDNQTRNFVPMGTGVVDIEGTLAALRQTGFDGYVSFEEVGIPTVKANAVRFLQIVRKGSAR